MGGDVGYNDYLDRHVADEGGNPLTQLNDYRMREALVDSIGSLPEREKLVMSLYYEEEMNLKEIGAVLGVTESRICQIHGQAIVRLRARMSDWREDQAEGAARRSKGRRAE